MAYIFNSIQSIFGVIVIILIWTQVSPVNAMWDVTLIDQQRRISQTDLLGVEYFSQCKSHSNLLEAHCRLSISSLLRVRAV